MKEKHDIELIYPASLNDDKVLEVSFEKKKNVIKNITNNNILIQKKSFDESENALRNSRMYEKMDEEPLSFREKISEDDIRDESLYETQSSSATLDTKEIITSRSLSGVEKTHENVDSSQHRSKDEGSIKISLTGRIQVSGGFNQTPVLISFDAIPDGSSATRSSLTTELSNSIEAVETTVIDLPDSNAATTFDPDPSIIIEPANDEASDSLNMTADEDPEAGRRTKTSEVAIKFRGKFFDLAGGSEEEQLKTTKKTDSSRIEKRLDKYGGDSRTAKRIFLTDYSDSSIASSSEPTRRISERADEAVDKLDPRVSAVRFPDILGSVLVDKDSRERDQTRARIEESEIDRSSATDFHGCTTIVPSLEKPSIEKTDEEEERDGIARCPGEDSQNVTSGGCYGIPATVRKLELPETTVRELRQTWSNYRDSDSARTFPPDIQAATTNDRNAGTLRFSSARSEAGNLDQTTTNVTFPNETSCRCDDESSNAIRARNMVAVVRFLMKLSRIVADEASPCLRAGEIRVKDVVVDGSSRAENNAGKQKSALDRTTTMSKRERQDFTTTERRSTIAERIREETSPLNAGTFESGASTSSSPSDEAFKNEVVSSAFFRTSTRRKVHVSALPSRTRTLSAGTTKSFLFYEPVLREDASGKNIGVPHLIDVEENVSFNDSKERDSEARKSSSRLDESQTNRSRRQNQDRNSADRRRLGKQEIASATNFGRRKIASGFRSARNKNVGRFRSSSNDSIGPSIRDTGVSRDALLEDIDALKRDGLARSRRSKRAGISDRRDARTKLLNGSAGGSSDDWIGEHRATATRRLVDKKLRESRQVAGSPEKVVFRRVRAEINRPGDPNLGGGASDSVKIAGHVAVNGPPTKLSTDDAPPTVSGDSSSLKRADSPEKARSRRYSSVSSISDNVDAWKIDEEVANEPTRSVTI